MNEDGKDYIDVDNLHKFKGLQIVQLNVRSLYHKIDTLKHDILKRNIGVLGITETWLKKAIPRSLINADGFYILRNDREKGRGGGTCLYINTELKYEVLKENTSNKNVEIQSVALLGNA